VTRSAPSRRRFADEVIVSALAGGDTQEAAARAAGVSLTTVKRRLASPEFRQRIDDARGDLVGRTLDLLTAGAAEGVIVLRAIAADSAAPPAVRVSAARALVALVLPHRDQIELAQRIDQLERQSATGAGHLRGVPS
jgi:hypothetical protein